MTTKVSPRLTHLSEYNSWRGMVGRCENPNNTAFSYYGGRGIKICARWRASFANFLADMGPKPSPAHSLDRRDPNGNYEAENCRWATRAEQRINQRPYDEKARAHAAHESRYKDGSVLLELTGQRFGRLIVLKAAGSKGGKYYWLCRCDCGTEAVKKGKNLRNGNTKSCGCLKFKHRGMRT